MINKRKYRFIGDSYPVLDFTKEQVEGACESLACEFGDDTNIDEAIHEVADSFTPIYYVDLYRSVIDVHEWIEEAVDEGIAILDPGIDPANKKRRPFRLHELIQTGWYYYLEKTLRENLDTILFNFLADIANVDPRIKDDQWADLEEELDTLTENVDPDVTFGWYREKYLDILKTLGIGKED